jgi:hypothetical protein
LRKLLWVVAAIIVIALVDLVLRVEMPRQTGTNAAGSQSSAGGRRNCGGMTITGDSVGSVRVGESVDSLKSRCTILRDTTQQGLEGMMERRILVDFQPDTLEAEIVDGKVWRLDVKSPAFRTADSLGVGTPLSGLLHLAGARGLVGEGVLAVVSPERCGLSFMLSGGIPARRVRSWDRNALSTLPASTKVREILVFGCRAANRPGSPARG